ncbi:uncharacterized protein METZ01_LOCUS395694, partial [marine metagenome]
QERHGRLSPCPGCPCIRTNECRCQSSADDLPDSQGRRL